MNVNQDNNSLYPNGNEQFSNAEVYTSLQNPDVVVRSEDDATNPVRFGKRYQGGGEAEYRALLRLYAADPKHVVRPLEPTERDGRITGFTMERVEGKTLREVMGPDRVVPKHFVDQIAYALKKFHKQGLAHGDVHASNIVIQPDGTIKFIDPVGYGEIPPDEFEKYRELDWKTLKSWVPDLVEPSPKKKITEVLRRR